jgi:hypothetical protein
MSSEQDFEQVNPSKDLLNILKQIALSALGRAEPYVLND